MDTTPPSLLEQLRGPGEKAAWERFVQLYTPLVSHWARHLGLQGADGAELVEEVFGVLVDNLPQFRYDPAQPFSGWVWAITLDTFAARRRRLAASHPSGEGELIPIPAGGPGGGFGELEYRQYLVQRTLELIRREFEPATWRAFREFAVAGRPAEEVARDLGIGTLGVYLATARTLRRLRTYLAGLLD
jgi:RNA polymerase sigma-70 factor (ECF subfamily)